MSLKQDEIGVITDPVDTEPDFSSLKNYPESLKYEDLEKMTKLELETLGIEYLFIDIDRRKKRVTLVEEIWSEIKKLKLI
jgi:hypothetical protein